MGKRVSWGKYCVGGEIVASQDVVRDGLHITTTVSTKIYFIMQNLTAKFREISYP